MAREWCLIAILSSGVDPKGMTQTERYRIWSWPRFSRRSSLAARLVVGTILSAQHVTVATRRAEPECTPMGIPWTRQKPINPIALFLL
jgi:hypothetical protein